MPRAPSATSEQSTSAALASTSLPRSSTRGVSPALSTAKGTPPRTATISRRSLPSRSAAVAKSMLPAALVPAPPEPPTSPTAYLRGGVSSDTDSTFVPQSTVTSTDSAAAAGRFNGWGGGGHGAARGRPDG